MMSRMKELEVENRRLKKIYLEKLKAEIVSEALKKAVRPSRRKKMDINEFNERGIFIRVACQAFRNSETYYRYERKFDSENEEVAMWLIKLTDNNRNWGFGLCYLYLRNLKGYKWNNERVYRFYEELELNLRIKPRKRLIR